MDDLKYLEEVLPAYRAGKTIYRSEFHDGEYHKVSVFQKDKNKLHDIPAWALTEKVWGIKKHLVSWPIAWEAMKAGKMVKDYTTGFIYRLDEDYTPPVINYKNVNGSFMISQQYTQTPPVINYKNVNGSFMISQQYTQIPLSWLDREDFEVLE